MLYKQKMRRISIKREYLNMKECLKTQKRIPVNNRRSKFLE
jgi:hypothetical protein